MRGSAADHRFPHPGHSITNPLVTRSTRTTGCRHCGHTTPVNVFTRRMLRYAQVGTSQGTPGAAQLSCSHG
jgi:hypothetical protein